MDVITPALSVTIPSPRKLLATFTLTSGLTAIPPPMPPLPPPPPGRTLPTAPALGGAGDLLSFLRPSRPFMVARRAFAALLCCERRGVGRGATPTRMGKFETS